MPVPLPDAHASLRPLLLDPDRLVRAVAAGHRRGLTPTWRRVELRPVELKAGRRLQVVGYDERQAHTSNESYPADAVVDRLLAEPFGNWHVETLDGTVQLRVTKKGEAQVHRSAPPEAAPTRRHDRTKARMLDPGEPLLHELGITTADGQVKPSRQDKYRQVDELLRALDVVLGSLPPSTGQLRVVDLGCGNAYLTFATHRFLTAGRALDVRTTGVDVKAQACEHGTALAERLGWSDAVSFVQGSALDAPVDGADVVLALHACDTATDEALARAVRWHAPVVLASPCCHHDIQRQLGESPHPYGAVTRHGILRERLADVLTDALRAAVLRVLGYRVEVVEFVGSEHTPRNTLIRAVRTGAAAPPEVLADYRRLTADWGVTPHLAVLLAEELRDATTA
jgi:SAM-dependent methyltransferase